MATWLLLRGLTREVGHWGDLPARWAAELPAHHRVLAIDLPGNGALHAATSPSDVAGMVEACRAQIAAHAGAAHAAAPLHVVAMSLGAMVAVAWSHAHPRELASLVLINTSLRPYSPFYRRLRPQSLAQLARLALTRADAAAWERTIWRLTAQRPEDAEVLAHWLQLRAQHPVWPANALRQLWAAARFRAPRAAPPCPVLILNGAADTLVHPSCSERLAKAWQAPMARHATAGHDLPLDDADWVLQQLRGWAAQQGERG